MALRFGLPLALVSLSVCILKQTSDQTSSSEVLRFMNDCSPISLALSGFATALSFLLLSCTEVLAFKSNGTQLSWKRIVKVALISFGVTNTLSLGGLSTASLRFRFYLKDKIPAPVILRVIAFSSAGVWIGFFFLLGLCIFIQPIALPVEFHVARWQLLLLGFISLSGTVVYLFLAWRQKPVIHLFGQTLSFPHLKFAMAQTFVSLLDWIMAAFALYVLLPPLEGVGFVRFLTVFLVAQIAGNLTSVPGGLGILEVSTVYLLVPGREITPAVAAALVCYRFIYYALPLIFALVGIAVEEVAESTNLAAVAIRGLFRITASWVPLVSAFIIAAIGFGLMTLDSATSSGREISSVPGHLTSNLALSVYGFLFLFIADGLRRRSLSAWTVTIFILAICSAALVVMHAAILTTLIPISVCAILMVCRSEFYCESRLFDELLSRRWSVSVGLLTSTLAILVISGYSNEALAQHNWWQLVSNGPNWLVQAGMPLAVTVAGLSTWRLIIPNGRSSRVPYIQCTVAQVAEIAKNSPVTQSQLVLLGDKEIFTNRERDAYIMYAVEGKTWVALGDPVTSKPEPTSLASDFNKFVNLCGGVPVFYQVQPQQLTQYLEFGYQFLKLGEEARVHLPSFDLVGRNRKSLRNTCNRMESKNVTFEILPRENLDNHWPELKAISDSWLAAGPIKERGFSLGYYDQSYLSHFDFAILRENGKMIAFVNLWQSPSKAELSVDLMRSYQDSPSGCMEYLFIKTMEWGRAQGYQYFNLGMAPLSGLEAGSIGTPFWNQLGSVIFASGESFYNFKGVRAFKDKFEPTWEPRYLAYPSGIILPIVLADVARLIARGGRRGSKS